MVKKKIQIINPTKELNGYRKTTTREKHLLHAERGRLPSKMSKS
jgi:hypothetical protein